MLLIILFFVLTCAKPFYEQCNDFSIDTFRAQRPKFYNLKSESSKINMKMEVIDFKSFEFPPTIKITNVPDKIAYFSFLMTSYRSNGQELFSNYLVFNIPANTKNNMTIINFNYLKYALNCLHYNFNMKDLYKYTYFVIELIAYERIFAENIYNGCAKYYDNNHINDGTFKIRQSFLMPNLYCPSTIFSRERCFNCPLGYKFRKKNRVCCNINNGQACWNGNPKCLKITEYCRFVNNDDHLVINEGLTKNSARINETLRFSCQYGYYLEGDPWLICEGENELFGKLSRPFPVCKPKINYCRIPYFENGKIHVNHKAQNFGTIGSSFYFSCNGGYIIKGSHILTCISLNDHIGQFNKERPKCQLNANYCPDPYLLSKNHLEVTVNQPRTINTEYFFFCHLGYRLIKPYFIYQCVYHNATNGQITNNNQLPYCEIIEDYCLIELIPYGIVMNDLKYLSINNHFTVECELGYKLSGNNVIKCIENTRFIGQFNDSLPKCESIENFCDVNIIKKYFMRPKLKTLKLANDSFLFSCDLGYMLKGRNTLDCRVLDFDYLYNYLPSCSKIISYCTLNGLKNGKINNQKTSVSVSVNEKFFFSCDVGYILKGKSNATCIEMYKGKGIVDNPLPTCAKISYLCNIIPPKNTLINNQTNPIHGLLNQVFTFSCKPRYVLVGSKSVKCIGPNHLNSTSYCIIPNKKYQKYPSVHCDYKNFDLDYKIMCIATHKLPQFDTIKVNDIKITNYTLMFKQSMNNLTIEFYLKNLRLLNDQNMIECLFLNNNKIVAYSKIMIKQNILHQELKNCQEKGFWFYKKQLKCLHCIDSEANCPGNGSSLPKKGYWSENAYSPPIKCKNINSCKGALFNTSNNMTRTDNCNTELGYSGKMCSQCLNGWNMYNLNCHKCGSYESEMLYLCAAIFIAFMYYAIFAALFNTLDEDKLDILVMGIMFSQIFTQMIQNASVNVKPDTASFLQFLDFINFKFEFMKNGCILKKYTSFINIYWISIFFVLMIMLIFICSTSIRFCVDCIRDNKKYCINVLFWRLTNVLCVIGFVFHLHFCIRVFNAINCNFSSNKLINFLSIDRKIQCYENNHYYIIILSYLILIIYIIGFPVFIFYKIKKYRKNDYQNAERLSKYGFIYRAKKSQFWWYFLPIFIINIFVGLNSLIYNSFVLQIFVCCVIIMANYFFIGIFSPFKGKFVNAFFLLFSFVTIIVSIILLKMTIPLNHFKNDTKIIMNLVFMLVLTCLIILSVIILIWKFKKCNKSVPVD